MRRLIFAVLACFALISGREAMAQTTWVQVEAHPNINVAQNRAATYARNLQNVNGFVLTSGWYAISLGPFEPNDAANRLRQLRAQRAIPPDAFLVDSSLYRQQFFPVGANALLQAPQQPLAPLPGTGQASGSQQQATLAPAPPPEPREETPAEARRSESQLTRDQRAELQVALQWFGFYTGRIDAAFGRGTRGSMAAFQASIGAEQTGILTTRQRARLLEDYNSVLTSLGLAPVRDDVAGIEMVMPTAMVGFERYDPPFAHYPNTDGSGVRLLLISQTGNEASLLGLFDIMQTLEIVPLEGFRERKRDEFVLTGEDGKITSFTYATLTDGHVKGFTLIWPAGDEKRRDLALKQMRESFTTISTAVLPDAYGDGALDQSIDLLSGLQIRRPDRSRSGFYIDGRGNVLTTAEAVAGCGRITIDETYEATVAAQDAGLGLALLRPETSLAPLGYARFQAGVPRLQAEVAVAGYSYDGALSAPTLTFGTLADVRGLSGEDAVKRLALNANPGDAGGPVFDTSGSVLGMLLPPEQNPARQLPADTSFAADSLAIAEFLSNSGYQPAASDGNRSLAPEDLTRLAADMTVLVSCWN